jgi:hypothetical protein
MDKRRQPHESTKLPGPRQIDAPKAQDQHCLGFFRRAVLARMLPSIHMFCSDPQIPQTIELTLGGSTMVWVRRLSAWVREHPG